MFLKSFNKNKFNNLKLNAFLAIQLLIVSSNLVSAKEFNYYRSETVYLETQEENAPSSNDRDLSKVGNSNITNNLSDNALAKSESFFNQGIDKFNERNFNEAISFFSQAIEINPQYANAYLSRGIAYRKLQNNLAAIEDYSKAIELEPSASAYLNRGVARSRINDSNGALIDYSKAIDMQPDYIAAYLNRGNLKIQKKDFSGAIKDFNKVIELEPGSHKAYFSRGRAHSSLEQNDKAIQDYTQAIYFNNKYAEAFYNRSVIKSRTRDYLGSMSDAEQAKGLYNLQHNQKGLEKSNKLIEYIKYKTSGN
ncbi:MAG: tetratricopeptide repeat protein [Candidatus Caenarcaniphilales bacterium]|nr:tetratricopeptide repeat protein [Candidatus Caenarcaniphilales bacterium]